MKRNKITSLALALVITAGVLSGCDASTEPEMSFVDAADLQNSPLPSLSMLQFGENGEISSGTSSDVNSADSNTAPASEPHSPDNDSVKIIIPTVTEYNVCTAEEAVFDPEKVKNVIFGDVDITPEITYYDDEPPSYTWEYNGLKLHVDADYGIDITGEEKVTQMVTPESAVQVVAAKYEDVVGIKQIEFKKLELMYAATPGITDGKPDFQKRKLIPAWICTMNYICDEGRYGGIPRKEIILIDARTGAEII